MKHHITLFAALAGLSALLQWGCGSIEDRSDVYVSIHLQANQQLTEELVKPVTIEKLNTTIYVRKIAEFNEKDLARAEVDNSGGGPFVRLVFDEIGTTKLRWITTEHRNRRLVIFFDGRPVAAHYITQTINDGRLTVFADLPEAEVQRIVRNLQPDKLSKRK